MVVTIFMIEPEWGLGGHGLPSMDRQSVHLDPALFLCNHNIRYLWITYAQFRHDPDWTIKVEKMPLISTDHMIFSIMTFKHVTIRHEKLFELTKKSKLLSYLQESFNVKNGLLFQD